MRPEDEIRNLLAQYCHCLDSRDPEGYIALFSRDSRIITERSERLGSGVREHINDVYSNRRPENVRTKHTTLDSIISVHGEQADVVSSVVTYKSIDNGPWALSQVGRYLDKLIIEDGNWRFAERIIETDEYLAWLEAQNKK